MKYLCLIYCTEEELTSGTDFPQGGECKRYAEQLAARGNLVAAEALACEYTVTTLRLRNGRVTLSDGPLAATEMPLIGFHLIDARDLNDAIHIAAGIPAARTGYIEIRPVRT